MGVGFAYDIFISYSRKNIDWIVKRLVPELENHNFRICIDFKDFQSGSPIVAEMERVVKNSKRILLVLSDEYVNSEWAAFENIMGQTLDPAALNRKIIPVLQSKCKIPLRLSILHYRDLSNDDPMQWDLLIRDLM